jgi:hypothetical protein
MNRVCRTCGVSKPFSAYRLNANGLRRWKCRVCTGKTGMAWARANLEAARDTVRRYYRTHKNAIRLRKLKHRRANADKLREYWRNWRARNKALVAEYYRSRQARKMRACPPWLTNIQRAQIAEFYEIAAAITTQTGVPHEVDHIHPLQGRNFRGLHVPWNLQILTAELNRAKHNSLVEAI